ncbi:MAG TPA: restriction endonuclease [Smithellaceae bacterium]|nr:restriction endonuclease [Smithellaceae bacterium]HRS88114.1 restriction endonuclease [Smithellaceae bacterium]HRV25412.1 restriction endonuclease [Smithellaceae bacterium]
MAIPDYQSIMLPLLELLSDSKEHTFREMVEFLASKFNLTDEERKELLPSGQQAIFDNRVGWARTYLKKAALIESPRRGVNQITKRGINALVQKPDKIDVKYLEQFPEFIEFRTTKKEALEIEDKEDISNNQTPEEILEYSYQKIRKSLSQDLLNKIINLPPAFFEKLVVDLIVKMGYGGSIKDAGKAIGKTNDEGIDGTIKEDKLGLDVIYLQAKRWQPGNIVGRPEIQKFVGALAGQGAKKGIFITTSSFSKEAIEYTPKNETKIVLIDGERLAQLIIDYDLGVSSIAKYEVKRIDNDYFGEE